MTVVPVTGQDWLFSPPLDVLRARLANGRFDALRPRPLPGPPPCATANVIDAEDPDNPTERDVFFANGLHRAVDLDATAGDCVYSASSGRVVRVERDAAETKGNVTIDHQPPGRGFVTKYLHVTGIRVEEGEFVQEGEPIAQVSAAPEQAHLHFELWARGVDLVPVDPTRPLYAWERRLVADEPLAGPEVPAAVGVVRVETVPFFLARLADGTALHVPMYAPMTPDERLTVGLLRDAHRRRTPVQLWRRASAFWGLDVVTQAEVAG